MDLLSSVQILGCELLGHLGFAEVPWYGNLLLALWLWCFGANVGSFMNVVVCRLPAGVSVVTPRSRCPKCGHLIRWFDNIPVLSWCLLRARCRDCGLPISARYPLVEGAIAAMFVVLAFWEPVSLGNNLPEPVPSPPLRLQTMFSLWLMCGLQLLLLCTLACAALIRYDGHRPPGRLFFPAMVVGLAAPLADPRLRPIPFHTPLLLAPWMTALLDGLAGWTVGLALALLMEPRARRSTSRQADVAAWALTGLVLGWQAAAALAPVSAALRLAITLAGRRWKSLARIPPSAELTFVAFLYIMLWRTVVDAVPWLGPATHIGLFALAGTAVIGLAWVTARLTPLRGPYSESVIREDLGRTTGALSVHPQTTPDLQKILDSPSYCRVESDSAFLQRNELRPVRLQLEWLKPELLLAEHGVHSTIVVFGGTQIVEESEARRRLEAAQADLLANPGDFAGQRAVQRAERILAKARYYDAAREFGRIVSNACQIGHRCEFVVVTGGGPGIMEAANRGAFDLGAKSIGLNISIPAEQIPNPYITPELCFQFRYFALRKMHFLLRAQALVVFPGGFGTLDELFDALTLRQTGRMQVIPIILFGREYWEHVIDFQFLADEGVIADEHLQLIHYAETPWEAWETISRFHHVAAAASQTGETPLENAAGP